MPAWTKLPFQSETTGLVTINEKDLFDTPVPQAKAVQKESTSTDQQTTISAATVIPATSQANNAATIVLGTSQANNAGQIVPATSQANNAATIVLDTSQAHNAG